MAAVDNADPDLALGGKLSLGPSLEPAIPTAKTIELGRFKDLPTLSARIAHTVFITSLLNLIYWVSSV